MKTLELFHGTTYTINAFWANTHLGTREAALDALVRKFLRQCDNKGVLHAGQTYRGTLPNGYVYPIPRGQSRYLYKVTISFDENHCKTMNDWGSPSPISLAAKLAKEPTLSATFGSIHANLIEHQKHLFQARIRGDITVAQEDENLREFASPLLATASETHNIKLIEYVNDVEDVDSSSYIVLDTRIIENVSMTTVDDSTFLAASNAVLESAAIYRSNGFTAALV